MKFSVTLLSSLLLAFVAVGKGNKVDWSVCDQEVKAHCAKAKSDHDKHECLEKVAQEKLSLQCHEMNKKLEATFGEHKHGHK